MEIVTIWNATKLDIMEASCAIIRIRRNNLEPLE